ncbi:hypothetical protein HNQ94_000937 [Salirhabdus euzebyi]|uniref:Uncharacterized protein n=1 Tax=Salirhabdus euzebyi TaxID=394506 RepID=A0A841Q255_9BACI|nr:hypothetical protein [Salirhabdus euzebyi]MBB6452492.1 hypothetical protein [Salirhabdus euzebyi]
MYWETLPNWVWTIYYLVLLSTLGISILHIFRKQLKGFSIISIVITITVPIVSFLNSIGRGKGINEFGYFINQLQQGSLWSIYVSVGFLYLLFYWLLILVKNMNRDITIFNRGN